MPLSLIVAHLPTGSTRTEEPFLDFVTTLRRIDLATTPRPRFHVVCLPHTRKPTGELVAKRLRDALREAFVGLVTFPEHGTTAHQLLRAARELRSAHIKNTVPAGAS